MSNFLDFCRKELELVKAFDEEGDFYGGMTGNAVMELCEVFANQGHSGMSASLVSSIFHRLVRGEPLSPLTGEDDEWNEIGKDLFQNKRASNVFKENGVAYQSDYYIFKDKNGLTYTSRESRKEITFPYVVSHKYIEVEE